MVVRVWVVSGVDPNTLILNTYATEADIQKKAYYYVPGVNPLTGGPLDPNVDTLNISTAAPQTHLLPTITPEMQSQIDTSTARQQTIAVDVEQQLIQEKSVPQPMNFIGIRTSTKPLHMTKWFQISCLLVGLMAFASLTYAFSMTDLIQEKSVPQPMNFIGIDNQVSISIEMHQALNARVQQNYPWYKTFWGLN